MCVQPCSKKARLELYSTSESAANRQIWLERALIHVFAEYGRDGALRSRSPQRLSRSLHMAPPQISRPEV